jgi:two-component system, cell cycle sensor histidine kinase and response regulator CckA
MKTQLGAGSDEGSQPSMLEEQGRQITALKEALREAEDKYRILVENANDAIFVLQDGRIRFANPKALQLGGVLADDLDKIPYTEYLHPEEKETVIQRHEQRLKGEKILDMYPLRIITRKGDTFWAEVNAVRIDWDGKPATLNIIRDISSQKLIEQDYFQSESLATLRTLSGGMAHSINNLLMGIQGRVSLLGRDFEPEDANREHLNAIEACVMETAALTRQMLGFAQTGKYKVSSVNMNDVANRVARAVWQDRPPETLVIELQENLWPVKADPQQMEQVVNNIVLNADQALPPDGTLTIKTSNVELNEPREAYKTVRAGKWIKIAFRDNGPGMEETVRKRVFEPFFTTKGFGKHRGLGLSCVYGIIANHNGMVDVDSSPAGGTMVSIYLPSAEGK